MTRKPWLCLLTLAGACAGGQTGDDTGGAGFGAAVCEKSDVEVGLDQALPAGYTPRELIDVLDGATVQAYLLPAHTTADDRAIQPDDALAMTEVTLAFEPADDERVALFQGGGCGYHGFTVYGSLTATTLGGAIVLSAEGGIAGPPQHAYFWHGSAPASAGPPSPELYGDYVLCNSDLHPITVWMSRGELMGNLCTSEGLVRFPTACGGFAQAPLDEEVEPGLPLPSAVVERLQSVELDVAWSGTDRSPLELTITPAERACYQSQHDPESDGRGVRSTTAVEIAVAIEDPSIAFEGQASLVGSYGYNGDAVEAVSRLRTCTDLESAAVASVNERIDGAFLHIHACLSIIVRADVRLETALELSGPSKDRPAGAQPGEEPEELMERVLVLEAEP